MTDIIVVRQLAEDHWQWRYADNRHGWRDQQIHQGDLDALSENLPRSGMPAWYLVPGEAVVTQQLTAEARERRHLAKLVPYQLEEQAIDPVDDLLFSLGPVRDGKVTVAYTGLTELQQTVAQLETAGCDVQRCVADFLSLERAPESWTLCLDGERLLIHIDEGLGLAVELSLVDAVIPALLQRHKLPEQVQLYAKDAAGLAAVQERLPEPLAANEQLVSEEAGFWEKISFTAMPELDLRTGALGRRLPLLRWWQEWRVPAVATAAAFALAIATTAGQYWRAQVEQEEIVAAMHAVFRQAVPDADNVGDPERRLESMVAGLGGSQSSSNLMQLLSEVAPPVASTSGLSITSFRYSQDNRELQLNLEAEEFSLLEDLRSEISARGLTGELLRVSAQGEIHQARMRVVEGGP